MTSYKINFDKNKTVVDALSEESKLSKMDIKRLVQFGAVWIERGKKQKRLRRNDYVLNEGETAVLHFDEKILNELKTKKDLQDPLELFNFRSWGVWYKPPGHLSQGSRYGDLWSVLRFVEKKYKTAYLIHRLDREVSGLIVFAYTPAAASELNKLWNDRQVKKYYIAEVLGLIENRGWNVINGVVDDKESETKYRVMKKLEKTSLVEVDLITGRKHQIRKHFEMLGHPLMGDPRYGEKNKNTEGLKLQSYKIVLKGPGMNKEQEFIIPKDYLLFPLS